MPETFGIFATLLLYWLFSGLYARKRSPLLNPVLLSIAAIATFLWISGIPYEDYMASARFLSFLLGPAVVSLAVPVYKQRRIIAEYGKEIAVGIAFGCLTAFFSVYLIAKGLGAGEDILRSLAPKSVTTAIAVGVSEKIGGIPALTAVFVILTGIMGNAFGVELMKFLRIRDRVARGLAMGVTSHGLGTARIILDDELSGAVSGLAMALNGVLTAVILPYLLRLLNL
ncbi:CidB/LrgB family autolysis modulator [Pyrococcus yayanosii]|uniref:Putative effector of murein hydrolase n=1 Tax=Pyrococcus yayanosii (strain CH1 / JCM 16557) TaxID=529709 RepID=F8AHB7_PYRYC|nr:CidB/LrgB family autolysis modulator [Pyrococcus yayanosii]AEH24114.1 Putative effector of murein hydrolase [Pyrococcus yayanosii CH1]